MTDTLRAAQPIAAPQGPRERRVRVGHLALAIALIVIGALGTTALVVTVAGEGEYLALSRDVDFGAQLRSEDLVAVQMSSAPGLDPVAASDIDRVVGAYATMPLAAGALLTPAQVTAEPIPGPGENVVGITLRGDRLPAHRLRPGDPILLVAIAERSSAGSADDVDRPPQTWQATVTAVAGGDSGGFLGGGGSGGITLDVAVPAADGPTVATLAAANRLVVVLAGG